MKFRFLILFASAFLLAWPSTGMAENGGTPPTVLVDENVHGIDVQGAKVWWWYQSTCAPTATAATADSATPNSPSESSATQGEIRVEDLSRIPTAGGLPRTIFTHDVDNIACGQWSREILSNVVADDDFVYYMSNDYDGLVKLSVEANIGDEPTLIYGGQSQADEIVERGDYVWLMDDAYGTIRVHKETGAPLQITTVAQLGGSSRDLKIDEDYLYWNQSGFLKFQTANGGPGSGIAQNVSGYTPDFVLCFPLSCDEDHVLVAQGEQIRRYAINAGTFGPVLYDSPVADSSVEEMVADIFNIFFWERRLVSCEPFCTYNYALYRTGKSGGTPDLLYFLNDEVFGGQRFNLTLGGPNNNYIFWKDNGQLKRLPRDAEAITSVDVSITDVEVTQAIQDLNNSVSLIRHKRTGVRVHVDADGQNVTGIAARLYRINAGGAVIDGPITPTSGSNYLTIPNNADRATFDHAFYFALPADWVAGSTLRLRAELNPNQLPPEPNFSNNVRNTATLNLLPSPTLRTHLLVWGYTVNGTYYEPDERQDIWQARSWIRRTYPLASTTGGYESPDPGFRLKTRVINSPSMGAHIQQTSDLCLDMPEDDREFCAATYANNCAKWLRATEGIPNDELIYSMIWNEDTLPFPRGFASGSVSAGPTGPQTWGWDTDGSSGDWYMGHEVGHNAGRAHPVPASDNPATENIREGCGHSRSDISFPYANAAIGSGDMWGFDVGDAGLNSQLNPRVYPNSTWRDMMSYCDRQWISDYTYNNIYSFLSTTNVSAASTPQVVRAGSSTIALFGTIYDEDDVGAFQVVGLWDSPGPYSPPTGSLFQMRFLDGDGAELASYSFDGETNDAEPTHYAYDVVVPFPLTTETIELVRTSDEKVLATHQISANPPTITNVELVNASNPVTGTVTLQWQASDPDGDPLLFDVYYTDDGGATYAAYALGISDTSIELDTNQMAGSTQARFRVSVNDGTRTAEDESATFTMASKPPSVVILTPQDGLEVTYGTQVNFEAEVEDLQGHIADGDIRWSVNDGRMASTGSTYTAYLLPVGTNIVSVRATNGDGQTTEKTVTVIVNDDVDYPGPSLAVGPDQVHWQLAEGLAEQEPAVLTINNFGTGSLSWIASVDAAWVSLDAESGDTPGTLTLSVDSSQLTAGEPLNTTLVITGNNGQTVNLPVSANGGIAPVWILEPDSTATPEPTQTPQPTATPEPTSSPEPQGELYLPIIR